MIKQIGECWGNFEIPWIGNYYQKITYSGGQKQYAETAQQQSQMNIYSPQLTQFKQQNTAPYLTINKQDVEKIEFGDNFTQTSLSGSFCVGFRNLIDTRLVIPQSVTTIGDSFGYYAILTTTGTYQNYKFIENSNFDQITIPNATAAGNSFLRGCNGTINIPNMQSVGNYAFSGYDGQVATVDSTGCSPGVGGTAAPSIILNAPLLETIGDYAFCGGNAGQSICRIWGSGCNGGTVQNGLPGYDGSSQDFTQDIHIPSIISIGTHFCVGGIGSSGASCSGTPSPTHAPGGNGGSPTISSYINSILGQDQFIGGAGQAGAGQNGVPTIVP